MVAIHRFVVLGHSGFIGTRLCCALAGRYPDAKVVGLVSLLEFVKLVAPNTPVEATPGGDFGFAFDNTKARRLTGWEPRVPVRERLPILVENVGLKRTQEIETTA